MPFEKMMKGFGFGVLWFFLVEEGFLTGCSLSHKLVPLKSMCSDTNL
jgi:hypothetical protein